jgi:hypothetical protein
MTDREKVIFLYGFLYCQAMEMHQEGLFTDLSRSELCRLLASEVIKGMG